MKKILTALVLFVFAVLPMSVMAMQAITDNELSTISGQAGVSINLDTNINLQIGTLAWGDKDGLGTTEANGTGWVGVTGLTANARVKLRDDLINTALANLSAAKAWGTAYGTEMAAAQAVLTPTAVGTFITLYNTAYGTHLPLNNTGLGMAMQGMNDSGVAGSYNPATIANYGTLAPAFATVVADTTGANAAGYAAYVAYSAASAAIKPLTIDVATDSGTAHGVAGTTFVRIGLGSIGIYVSSVDGTVALGGGAATPTLNQELGSFYMGGLEVWINKASYVDIYNGRASGQGVTLGLNVVIDQITLSTLSWGDKDGFITFEANEINKNAGYVGLTGTTIAGLQILGPVTVDVATDAAGGKQSTYATTFVRIGFGDLRVIMGSLDATAVLGNRKDFSDKVDTLGTIYLSGLDVTFGAGSRVDIYNYYGKSGVVLDFAASVATINIATLSWGDADGVSAGFTTSYTNAGYVGLKNLAITGLTLNGITTIDVATVVAGNTSSLAAGTTFVRMGFNNVTMGIGSMDAVVALGTTKSALTQELGSIYMSTMATTINGKLDIYAPSTTSQGVVLAMDLSVTATQIAALSWGDSNGIGGATTAGFVGLKNLALGALTIAGKVSIDVATVAADRETYISSANSLMYAAYYNHLMSPNSTTFVHIGLGTGNAYNDPTAAGSLAIGLASMSADIALDSVKALSNAGSLSGSIGSGLLGSVYVGGVQAKVNGWVDIAAH